MKKYFVILIVVIFVCNALLANEELLQKFLQKNEKITTFKANFEQRNYWTESDIEHFSFGNLYTKDDKIKLEFYYPEPQTMLGTENDLRFYFPEKKQLLIQDWSYWQNFINPKLLAKEYIDFCELQSTDKYRNVTIFTFKPTEVMSDFSELVIQFSNQDSLIEVIEYMDNYDNEVGFKFTNKVINDEIPDSTFMLEIPENVSVVDQRTAQDK
ncbi:MAG: outer membrane lipoprotein carrier protein LolA [Candidatus Celaenobacter antarcticus]|nr:outer membrane lipoprotein carrier protein LolA [Candidatus Celaenobacter antarcticus]MDP8314708.1 outer membrane lipoprotein carrier protein LolA [Candidatus Celaenobacter antarcticus]